MQCCASYLTSEKKKMNEKICLELCRAFKTLRRATNYANSRVKSVVEQYSYSCFVFVIRRLIRSMMPFPVRLTSSSSVHNDESSSPRALTKQLFYTINPSHPKQEQKQRRCRGNGPNRDNLKSFWFN